MTSRPHVIFLMADTVTRQALSCYGGAGHTPNIDGLAQQAYRFERLYQPANMCQPSRVTWMTGCLPSRTQVYHNGFGNNARREKTLLRALAEAGYRGGYLGIFHCWSGADRDGLKPWGWIDWIHDSREEQHDWSVPHEETAAWQRTLAAMGITDPEEHLRDYRHLAGHTDFPIARHPAVRITDQAVECLADIRPGQPHALWVSYWMPHEPWAPPREFLEHYDLDAMPLPPSWREGLSGVAPRQGTVPIRESFLKLGPDIEANLRRVWRAYLGCMSLVDQQIGRILADLKRRGIYDDSLIVFLTDHGTTHGAHGWMHKGGSFMIDEVSRVPCLVKLPGQQHARTIPDIVASADLHPTVLDVLGIARDGSQRIDGASWSGLFAGKTRENARAFGQHLDGAQVGADAVRSLVRGNWKYNLHSVPGFDELYDLERDPHEQVSLVGEAAEKRREMRGELVDFIRSGSDRFVVPET